MGASQLSTPSSTGSGSGDASSKILTLKSTISYLKNENADLTETIQRQNTVFLNWQTDIKKEMDFLNTLLSSRQRSKYNAWREENKNQPRANCEEDTNVAAQKMLSDKKLIRDLRLERDQLLSD